MYKKPTTAVILAGGKGTRILEESQSKPKPMIEIGGKPILWHIMKIFDSYGIKKFIICAGYKQHHIKQYFFNFKVFSSDITIKTDHGFQTGLEFHDNDNCSWEITVADTGEETMTGGRIKRIAHLLPQDEPFLMTYGDGVADVNIGNLIEFHLKSNKMATVTGVVPPARFGALQLDKDNNVESFVEKPIDEGGFINGGFFVLSQKVIELIEGDETIFEQRPLKELAKQKQLNAYLHKGFWQPMDTLRDNRALCSLWNDGKAPWKIW
jgi:glucose-1-phosphate cytidylyltransferase